MRRMSGWAFTAAAVLLALPSSAAAARRRIPAGAVIRLADRRKGPATEPVRAPGRFSPDGRTFALIDADEVLKVYGLPAGGLVYSRQLSRRAGQPASGSAGARRRAGRRAVYSPDGRRLMLVDSDRDLRVVAVPEGELLAKLDVGDLDIACATFSPLSDHLAVTRRISAGVFVFSGRPVPVYEYVIEVWHLPTGERVLRLADGKASRRPAAFTPDGRGIAAVGKDDRLRLWSLGTGELKLSVPDAAGGSFSPDGRIAFVVDEEGVISAWDLATWTVVDGHRDDATSMTISSDGRFVALKMDDGSVRVVDAATGAEHLRLAEPGPGEFELEVDAEANWLGRSQQPAWDMELD